MTQPLVAPVRRLLDLVQLPTERPADHGATVSLSGRLTREVRGIREAWRVPAVRRGLLGTVLIVLGSFTPAFLPAVRFNPFYDVPVIGWTSRAPGAWIATAALLIGVLLLLDAWLRLRPKPGRPAPIRETLWLWALPVLLAPPLFSRDSYSYAAQGWLVARGIDPYTIGPFVAGWQYSDKVDPMWLATPAPYGPLGMEVQRAVVAATGDHAYLAAMLMRIPALVGVLLMAVLLPRLARALGYDGPTTTWLAVLNPLVLMHLVGGNHNDSLMIGLMILGLWLAVKRHPWWAAVAVGAAASVKLPGLAALLAVAALAARRTRDDVPPLSRVLLRMVPVAAVSLAVVAVLSLASGLGFGWVGSLSVPGSVLSVLSPSTRLGVGAAWLLPHLGVPVAAAVVIKAAQAVVLGLGGLYAAYLAVRWGPRAPVATLARVVCVIVVTNPTILPWYALWGGLLYAMTVRSRRQRLAVVWFTAALVVFSACDSSMVNGVPALGITAGLSLAWVASGHDKALDREAETGRRARPAAPSA